MPRALWTKAPLALLRHPVGLLAVACAAFLVATGAAAAPLMKAGAESEALQTRLRHMSPLAAGLVIDRPIGVDSGVADRRRLAAARALARSLPSVGAPILTTTTFGQLKGPQAPIGRPLLVVLMARTGATEHVQKLAGDGRGVWLSRAVARGGHVRASGSVTFVRPFPEPPGSQRVTLPVGAVYRELDADLGNPYWVNFIAQIRARNPDSPVPPTFALVTRAQVYRLARAVGSGELGNVYELPIDAGSITPGRAKHIANAFRDVDRALRTRTPLAAGLGCIDPFRPCTVSSELTDAVRIAAVGNASLRPVVDLLAGMCLLLALATSLFAGIFTSRRRAGEARLSLVRGEVAVAFFARSAIEAVVPALLGAAAGLALAAELVRLFTPHGAVDGSVVREAAVRVLAASVAAVLAVAAGATVARGRLGSRAPGWHVARRIPWEAALLAAAVAIWIDVAAGRGLVHDAGGSHPRLAVMLLPAAFATALAGLAGRVVRALLVRRAEHLPLVGFLAARRLAVARGLVVALTVTVAAGVASLAFAQILRTSLARSSTEKALVSNGSDVQGLVDAGAVVPPGLPYPATIVSEVSDAGRLADGRVFDAVVVDPPTLARVLAAHWPQDVRAAVASLAESSASLPAVSVGVATGATTLQLGPAERTVHIVARVRAFPGMQPGRPLLLLPRRALTRTPIGGLAYVWATGPPRAVESALARSSLSPSYLTALRDFSSNPDVFNITRTYAFLRVVALGVVLLSLVALLLYLNGRARAQIVASAFLRRLGLSQARQARSVALEAAMLVAVAAVAGVAAAVATASAIVGHVDPLAAYAPSPAAVVPWALMLGSAAGVVAGACVAAAGVTVPTRRAAIAEALRVS